MSDRALLSASRLTVRRGTRALLDDVSLEVTERTLLAIVGPNGAGKTTLLRALSGLMPFDGEVLLDGRTLRSFDPSERARRITYVPQQSLLASPLTVAGVVELGRFAHRGMSGRRTRADDAAVDLAMARAGVALLGDRLFTTLSLGEQRRVLIARALATEASILLLDEPDAFLDVAQTLSLFALLRELRDEGRSIVVVLHGLDDVVRSCDRTLLLDAGRCVAFGPTREALSAEHVRRVFGVVAVAGAATGYELPSRDEAR